MLLKFIATAAAAVVIWAIFFRGKTAGQRQRRSSMPAKPSYSLTKCNSCGAYRLPDAPCDCHNA